MAFGLLQNHLRNIKQRVSPAGHFDLTRQGLHSSLVGNQADIQFRQRRRRLPALARRSATRATAVAHAAFTTGSSRALKISFTIWRPSAVRTRTVSVTSGSWGTIASWRPGTSPIAPALGPIFAAFVLRILDRRRLLLCPRRQKELLQVKFVIRYCTHLLQIRRKKQCATLTGAFPAWNG